jgi:hypothetical protein
MIYDIKELKDGKWVTVATGRNFKSAQALLLQFTMRYPSSNHIINVRKNTTTSNRH